jgi:hypothetical protein
LHLVELVRSQVVCREAIDREYGSCHLANGLVDFEELLDRVGPLKVEGSGERDKLDVIQQDLLEDRGDVSFLACPIEGRPDHEDQKDTEEEDYTHYPYCI